MAYGGEGVDITLPAAADLSAAQFKLMTVDANGRGTLAVAVTDNIIGVLQNKPGTVDTPARIRISGISKLVFGAAVNEAGYITCNPEGYGTATTTANDSVVGLALAAPGGSGNIQAILVRPGKY